ncbi:MAG: type II toxin-antitoxin system RelE/ParE family toxin [Treponema sp.]|nr:type II toxin-antitoxin system RelE/ParE family toxin [Treponema sp.]
MKRKDPLNCVFFETKQKNQPVRDFLLKQQREDRKIIGADIFTVQEGFPLGYPLVEKVDKDLWEVRSIVTDGICCIFFTIHIETMILLHGFIKKSNKIPKTELKTVRERLSQFRS